MNANGVAAVRPASATAGTDGRQNPKSCRSFTYGKPTYDKKIRMAADPFENGKRRRGVHVIPLAGLPPPVSVKSNAGLNFMIREKRIIKIALVVLIVLVGGAIGLPAVFVAMHFAYGTMIPWTEFTVAVLATTFALWGMLWWIGRRAERQGL